MIVGQLLPSIFIPLTEYRLPTPALFHAANLRPSCCLPRSAILLAGDVFNMHQIVWQTIRWGSLVLPVGLLWGAGLVLSSPTHRTIKIV